VMFNTGNYIKKFVTGKKLFNIVYESASCFFMNNMLAKHTTDMRDVIAKMSVNKKYC
jgi:hypothetical protein